MCVWLCVFNQTNKSQSFRCRGGLIKSLPAAGDETRTREEQELEEEKVQENNEGG